MLFITCAIKGASGTARDNQFVNHLQQIGSRLSRWLFTQAHSLIFIREQNIDMVFDKGSQRVPMPFGTPRIG